jgi:hypothetical protein
MLNRVTLWRLAKIAGDTCSAKQYILHGHCFAIIYGESTRGNKRLRIRFHTSESCNITAECVNTLHARWSHALGGALLIALWLLNLCLGRAIFIHQNECLSPNAGLIVALPLVSPHADDRWL